MALIILILFAAPDPAYAQADTPTPTVTPTPTPVGYTLPTQSSLPMCTYTPLPTQAVVPYITIPPVVIGTPTATMDPSITVTPTPTMTPTPTPNVSPAFYSETYTIEWSKGTGIWFSQRTHTYINESQLVAVAWRPLATGGGIVKRMSGVGPGNDAWGDTSDNYASGYYCTSDLYNYQGYRDPAAICSSLAPGATITGSGAYLRWITHQAPGTEGKQGWQCYGHSDNYVSCSLEVTVWRYGIPPVSPTATPITCLPPDQYDQPADVGSGWEIVTGPCYTLLPSASINISWLRSAVEAIVGSSVNIPDTIGWDGYQICIDYLLLHVTVLGINLQDILAVLVWVITAGIVLKELRS